jgi:hypothetical protein
MSSFRSHIKHLSEDIMKMSNARIGIGVILGIASIATLFGGAKVQTGYGKVRESWRARRGESQGEFTHGGHISAPQGKEKVEVTEMGGIP